MSHYSNLDGAKLVNQFTIEHSEKPNSGRPFLSTCIPQPVNLELSRLQIRHAVEWQEKYTELSRANYNLQSSLRVRGVMEDRITVFQLPGGRIASFDEIAEIIIKPIAQGHVGGKRKATARDGIFSSGFSAREIPENGLMEGEPGVLLYIDPRDKSWPSEHREPYLCLEGYIDEAEFNTLVQRLSMIAAPIEKATLRVLLELFEYEVDAALGEPWHRKDYGFLVRETQNNWGTTRARVETLEVVFQPNNVPAPNALIDEDGTYQLLAPFEPVSAAIVRKIEKRLGQIASIIGIGLMIIIVMIIAGRQ